MYKISTHIKRVYIKGAFFDHFVYIYVHFSEKLIDILHIYVNLYEFMWINVINVYICVNKCENCKLTSSLSLRWLTLIFFDILKYLI